MPDKQNESLSSKVEAAFRQAATKVVQQAKQTGTPVVVWEKGRVREVPAEAFDSSSEPPTTESPTSSASPDSS